MSYTDLKNNSRVIPRLKRSGMQSYKLHDARVIIPIGIA